MGPLNQSGWGHAKPRGCDLVCLWVRLGPGYVLGSHKHLEERVEVELPERLFLAFLFGRRREGGAVACFNGPLEEGPHAWNQLQLAI